MNTDCTGWLPDELWDLILNGANVQGQGFLHPTLRFIVRLVSPRWRRIVETPSTCHARGHLRHVWRALKNTSCDDSQSWEQCREEKHREREAFYAGRLVSTWGVVLFACQSRDWNPPCVPFDRRVIHNSQWHRAFPQWTSHLRRRRRACGPGAPSLETHIAQLYEATLPPDAPPACINRKRALYAALFVCRKVIDGNARWIAKSIVRTLMRMGLVAEALAVFVGSHDAAYPFSASDVVSLLDLFVRLLPPKGPRDALPIVLEHPCHADGRLEAFPGQDVCLAKNDVVPLIGQDGRTVQDVRCFLSILSLLTHRFLDAKVMANEGTAFAIWALLVNHDERALVHAILGLASVSARGLSYQTPEGRRIHWYAIARDALFLKHTRPFMESRRLSEALVETHATGVTTWGTLISGWIRRDRGQQGMRRDSFRARYGHARSRINALLHMCMSHRRHDMADRVVAAFRLADPYYVPVRDDFLCSSAVSHTLVDCDTFRWARRYGYAPTTHALTEMFRRTRRFWQNGDNAASPAFNDIQLLAVLVELWPDVVVRAFAHVRDKVLATMLSEGRWDDAERLVVLLAPFFDHMRQHVDDNDDDQERDRKETLWARVADRHVVPVRLLGNTYQEYSDSCAKGAASRAQLLLEMANRCDAGIVGAEMAARWRMWLGVPHTIRPTASEQAAHVLALRGLLGPFDP